jgi:hypothetical protein
VLRHRSVWRRSFSALLLGSPAPVRPAAAARIIEGDTSIVRHTAAAMT